MYNGATMPLAPFGDADRIWCTFTFPIMFREFLFLCGAHCPMAKDDLVRH
jgi:hypothetical protein